nr:hypothetical protein [Tanacetum cinerariifolium]
MWRAALNRLPTRVNLEARGVPIPSSFCPFCGEVDECIDHCLISCSFATKVWRKVWDWWNLGLFNSFPPFSIQDIAMGLISSYSCIRLNKIIHGVFQCSLWAIWKWRNKLVNAKIEDVEKIREEDIFPSIQCLSKSWISARFSKGVAAWDRWVSRPFDVS